MGVRQDRATAGDRRHPLGDSDLPKKHHVTVVPVEPENATSFTHADYDTVLTYGSVIVIGGRPADVERFVDLQ